MGHAGYLELMLSDQSCKSGRPNMVSAVDLSKALPKSVSVGSTGHEPSRCQSCSDATSSVTRPVAL